VQYHFEVTPKIKPYVGAAFHAGIDSKIDKNWSLNADIKKYF
jgi:outer membrane protein W